MKRFLVVLVASMFLASAAYAADGMKEEKKAAAKSESKSKGDEKKAKAKAKAEEKKAEKGEKTK